jgi:NAD(P)-dependent dehydrogenase (short-subunit alcohol dehydrogenase family)
MSSRGYRVGYLAENSADIGYIQAAAPETLGTIASGLDEIGPALRPLVDAMGTPRVLILCDEQYASVPATEGSWELVEALMKRTFLRRLEAVRTLVPHLATTGHGRIINLVHRDWLGWSQVVGFSAANGALVSLTRSLAWELAKLRITVNAVVTGVICTPGDTEFHGRPLERWLLTQPIQRIASPDDAAKAVAFLADIRSDFISGQLLYFDGGRCIYSSLTA